MLIFTLTLEPISLLLFISSHNVGYANENVQDIQIDRNRLVHGIKVHIMLGLLHNPLRV